MVTLEMDVMQGTVAGESRQSVLWPGTSCAKQAALHFLILRLFGGEWMPFDCLAH